MDSRQNAKTQAKSSRSDMNEYSPSCVAKYTTQAAKVKALESPTNSKKAILKSTNFLEAKLSENRRAIAIEKTLRNGSTERSKSNKYTTRTQDAVLSFYSTACSITTVDKVNVMKEVFDSHTRSDRPEVDFINHKDYKEVSGKLPLSDNEESNSNSIISKNNIEAVKDDCIGLKKDLTIIPNNCGDLEVVSEEGLGLVKSDEVSKNRRECHTRISNLADKKPLQKTIDDNTVDARSNQKDLRHKYKSMETLDNNEFIEMSPHKLIYNSKTLFANSSGIGLRSKQCECTGEHRCFTERGQQSLTEIAEESISSITERAVEGVYMTEVGKEFRGRKCLSKNELTEEEIEGMLSSCLARRKNEKNFFIDPSKFADDGNELSEKKQSQGKSCSKRRTESDNFDAAIRNHLKAILTGSPEKKDSFCFDDC